MGLIVQIGLWLHLSDEQIDSLLNIYCKIKYGYGFTEILEALEEENKK